MTPINNFKKGLREGMPICMGYLAVSFTFGMLAKQMGLSIFQAVVISVTNLTSAGQFAGLELMTTGAPYLEMALAQLIINLRYCLMSCSLSQKIERSAPLFHRFTVAYGVTDEIFAVSVSQKGEVSPYYSYGVISISLLGWGGGTFLGALSGALLPGYIISALGIAIYGMFLAIILPPAKQNKAVMGVVITAMLMSFIMNKAPILSSISTGFQIIIITVCVAGGAAILHPIKETEDES